MSRVICDLPNASLEISGVRFQKLDDGRFISDEIGDEATAIFLGIPGYVLDEDESELPAADAPPVAQTKTQIAAAKKAATKSTTKAPVAKPAEVVETPVVVEPVIPAVTEAAPVVDGAAGDQTNEAGETDPVVVDGVKDPVTAEDEPTPNVF